MRLSMSKLLMISLLGSSFLNATSIETKIENFFKRIVSNNPMYKVKNVKVKDHKDLKQLPGWKVYFLDIDLNVTRGPDQGDMKVHEKVFTNGKYIVRDFININNHRSLKREIGVDIKDNSIYNKEHLIYGTGKEPHKVVVFSDPLCPFCQDFMPDFLNDVKKHPGKIAVYYYHLPLSRLHLASPTMVRLMLVAKKRGVKDVELKTYQNSDYFVTDEKDEEKTIRAFNQVMGTNITKDDIHKSWIDEKLKEDKNVADELMISGTPTIYLDGKKDPTREKYKSILGIK